MTEDVSTDNHMTFFEHLDELRRRLVYMAIAVVVGAVIAWFFVFEILELLMVPLPEGEKLGYRTVTEPFITKIKLALVAGAGLMSPVILYQFLSFLNPALQSRERRVVYPVLFVGALLFAMGVSIGYTLIMPTGVKWLVGQAGDNLISLLTVSEYVGFVTMFLFAVGMAFESPLFILLLVRLGIVTPDSLQRNWRIAILTILISASILTPDASPITMALLAGPMLILYFATVVVAKFMFRKRAAAELAAASQS